MNTIERIIDLAVQIQQIAAPTFHEGERAEFVRKLFVKEGLKDVTMDETGNVYGRWTVDSGKWTAGSKPLVVSAHLDTVFPFEMDLSVRREDGRLHGIGIGDNSLGVAALFGLMWMFRERNTQLGGDVWFVANTCEEGLVICAG
jgi:tripeptide aminopeptidase